MITSNANADGLIGTWKLISNRIRMEDTGEEFDLFGANPRGVITFAPNGRMTAILTTAERPSPVSEADFKALIMGMSAYAGRFSIQDDHVVIDPDVVWLPYAKQIRYFELEGDRLTLRTPVQELPIRPGRLLRNTIVWEREI
jgi:lipocalin-like protein